ncbi:5494_t:CDS:2 [Ambispora gerdemannii]|uniref:5494_t:CDS:1 n=1 Tax=Ambispora gerdemannii TaxID=144530 RepID=A0A9N9BKU3_9GLOM|nr:5494_t:CDS:2 [Ambispora gerdemannii]
MVLLVLTERIRKAVFVAMESPEFDSAAKARLKSYIKGSSCLPLDLVKEVSKFLVSRDGKLGREIGLSNFWLHELLTGSGVYVEQHKEKPKNPKLIARLEEILAEQANKEYARMIGRVASSYDMETFKILDTEEFSSIRGQLTAIVNITFTVVAVFAAVYHVSHTITGDTGMRILLAGFGGLLTKTKQRKPGARRATYCSTTTHINNKAAGANATLASRISHIPHSYHHISHVHVDKPSTTNNNIRRTHTHAPRAKSL